MKMTGILAEKGLHTFDEEAKNDQGYRIPRIWILISDSSHAKIWRKGLEGLQEIACVQFHVISNQQDFYEYHKEDDVAQKLSDWLEEVLGEGVFDRLILISSKNMLVTFHEKLSTNVVACIAAEIPKDLAYMNNKEIGDTLEKLILI